MIPHPSRKRRRLLAAVVLAAVATSGILAAGEFPTVSFEKYDLPNGLRVILSVDRSAPVVATFVHYHVGSKNERPDRTGFAHFFEHLMFEATENIPRKKLDEILQTAGARRNASTTEDQTYYWLNLPANQLELALWIESERMLHAKVEEIGVETQRGVVKEEKKQRLDNQPYSSFNEYLHANLAAGTPYAWLPIGSAQYIDQATIDEFREFYNTYYVPNNAVLVIVGDIDIAATKKFIDKYFSDIPRGREIARPTISLGLGTAEKVIEVREDKTPLPGLVYGYRTVGRGHPDAYALNLLSRVLAVGNSSRMYRHLVDEKRVALEAAAFLTEREQTGFFKMLALAYPTTSLEQLGAAMEEEIAAIQKNGVTDREFRKALNQVRTEYAQQYSDVLQKAQELAFYEVMQGDANLINTEFDRYLKLTPEDLRRVAKNYLVPTNRVVLKYIPPVKEGGR